ncbi:MAG: C25 family peptidase propeptide domain-containing protein, partial [Pseudomonadota bacterium]|nr:C25 family peptidase propeptide domain-containing protein [Pseudomonadota bacterium]
LIAGAMMMVSAGPAAAAIQKVQDLGTNNSKAATTTLSVTLSSGVTNGNSVIISFAADDGGGTVTCADDVVPGNTYNVDVDVTSTNNVRTVIISAHNVSGLVSGKTITVTLSSSGLARAMSVTEFSGLVTSSTLDQTKSSTGTGTAPSSTATASTTFAHELLIGAIGFENKPNITLTAGSGWANLPKDGTGTGGPTTNITIAPEYQIVTATGTYTADGTLSSSVDWAAAIATYKRLDYYLDQVHYRWRNDDGTEATASWGPAEDTKIYGIQKGTGVQRLRFLVSNEGTQGSGAIAYQLQVAETATCSSGTYSAVPTDATGDWQIIASQLVDGAVTTTISGLTDPVGYTWVDGEQKDSANTTGSITLAASEFTEIEFSIQATSNATDSGDYCFQLYDAGGDTLDNYTIYAEARIIPATAVTLASFNARGENHTVRVDWQTAQEIRNLGFNLYRGPSPSGPFIKLNDSIIPGLKYSVKGKSYSFVDTNVSPGQLYYYKLEDIDVSGIRTFHGPVCVDWDADGIPDDWEIAYGLNPWVYDADEDADNDGLTNLKEYELGFDPFNPDSDGDGILDGQEDYRIEREDSNGSRGLTRGVQILASDESGITLELFTGTFDTEVVTAGGQEFERLRIADYIHGHTQELGKPEVPVKGIFLDLPEGQSATLSVLQTEVDTYDGYQVFPVPENIVDDQGAITAVGESFVWNESAYAVDEFYPAGAAQLGDGFVFRGQIKQQVLFYPLSFNPATGELRHYRKIRIRIEYAGMDANLAKIDTRSPAPWQLPITNGTSESIPSVGQMAIAFGASPIMVNPISPVLSSLGVLVNALWSPDTGAQGTAYKILVEEEGIYRLTRDYLANNGVDVDALDLSQLRIYNLGAEIAIYTYDQNGDDVIDSSDYIEFYGQPVTAQYAKYGRNNVYWLVTVGGTGIPRRMAEIDGTPAAGALAATH